jgi:hypothetical protein
MIYLQLNNYCKLTVPKTHSFIIYELIINPQKKIIFLIKKLREGFWGTVGSPSNNNSNHECKQNNWTL